MRDVSSSLTEALVRISGFSTSKLSKRFNADLASAIPGRQMLCEKSLPTSRLLSADALLSGFSWPLRSPLLCRYGNHVHLLIALRVLVSNGDAGAQEVTSREGNRMFGLAVRDETEFRRIARRSRP
jgi:hypothetical protein